MRIKSSEAIIKVLEEENVSHIFSLPGGHIQPIFDAIYDSNLQLISVRHEQAADHMADGYARFKRELGGVSGNRGSRSHEPRNRCRGGLRGLFAADSANGPG
ncbi:MAG: thiamine pyrophosphate-binding protein [Candidatus Freyrarchaeum guaymaensis]